MMPTSRTRTSESIGEITDRYEVSCDEDPLIQQYRAQIEELFGCLYDVLEKGNCTQGIAILDELDQKLAEMGTEELRVYAATAKTDMQKAFDAGKEFFLIERQKTCLPCENLSL